MNLTAEEKALIEQKRAEKIAEEKAKLASYDHHKETVINRENTRISQYEKDEEDRKRVYEKMYAELTDVSPDYKLECVKVNQVNKIDIYDVDENGYEIKTKKNTKGETIWLKPKEVLKFKFYSYNLKLSYTGKVPEGHNYYVVPVSQYSKWSYRITGYKMQVQGTGISSWDKRGQMTNPNSVHKKIVETVDGAFKQIEYKTAQEQSNDRILNRFKVEFSEYVNNFTVSNSTFVVKLDNGIEVTFYAYEDNNGNITFKSPNVKIPYGVFEVKDMLSGLEQIKGKE
jgi:hypothetical protein